MDGVRLTVLALDGRRIERLRVTRAVARSAETTPRRTGTGRERSEEPEDQTRTATPASDLSARS